MNHQENVSENQDHEQTQHPLANHKVGEPHQNDVPQEEDWSEDMPMREEEDVENGVAERYDKNENADSPQQNGEEENELDIDEWEEDEIAEEDSEVQDNNRRDDTII